MERKRNESGRKEVTEEREGTLVQLGLDFAYPARSRRASARCTSTQKMAQKREKKPRQTNKKKSMNP
jgi:hypothetical protein